MGSPRGGTLAPWPPPIKYLGLARILLSLIMRFPAPHWLLLSVLLACRAPAPDSPGQPQAVAVAAAVTRIDPVRASAFIQPWAEELLQSEALQALESSGAEAHQRLLVYLAGFANDSQRPIELEPLTSALERALLGSGRLRFAPQAPLRADIAARALNLRRSGSPIDKVALRLGRQLGARVALFGVLDEGQGESWLLTLSCLDLADGQVLWHKQGEWDSQQADSLALR